MEPRIGVSVHPDIKKIAAEIAFDKKSGATALAGRALDALEALARNLGVKDSQSEAKTIELVEKLDNLRPSMGAIGTQAVLAAAKAKELAGQGFSWPAALTRAVREERELLLQADEKIAAFALAEIGGGGIIATCSFSKTVQTVLLNLKPAKVLIGEGHRLGDGTRAAKELAHKGLDVILMPDGALPSAVRDARAALIGADQVLCDGRVVNRCSSFSMALAASYWKVPLFVACQSIKLTGGKEAPIEESTDLFDDAPEGVSLSAPIFDITPAPLVYRVITERGIMTPEAAGKAGLLTADLRNKLRCKQ